MLKISKIFNTFSKTERYLLVGAILIFATSAIFLGIRLFYEKTTEKPIEGGVYSEGLIGQLTAINPLIAANDVDRDLIELIYEDLLGLTESYRPNEDQRVWTFNLKQGLKWSDGEPITSDDVLFTLEAIQDPDTRSPLFPAWQGVVGERLSERQFRFALRTPFAFFLDNLKNLKIVPRHIFENIPTANLRLSNYNLEPIGSGPYQFASYSKRKDGFFTKYNLQINENYAGNRPFIKEFSFHFFSTKEDLLKAFNNREIEAIGGLDYKDIEGLKIGRQIFEINIPSYYAIFFNPALNSALKEKDVRQALAYATDKSKIAREVFGNYATIINGPLVPGMEGYDPEIYKDEIFSPEEAQKILDGAKWVFDEKEGVRTKTINKIKVKLEFDIIVPQAGFLTKTADLIKSDWQAIGVKLNPIVMRPSEVNNEIIKTRNYQLLIFGTILKGNPDIFSFWHSSERFYPGGNLALFSNKTADLLLESIKSNLDQKSREENLHKVQSLIMQERPAIFLFSPTYFYVTAKNLKGFSSRFLDTRSNRFDDVNKWYLKTARVFK